MAGRQLLRRLSPLMSTVPRLLPAMKPTLHACSKTASVQKLPTHLAGVQYMSTKKQPNIFNVQDEEDFKERVIDSKIPVIVDFHATWCGPCKLLGPRLENVASEFSDKVVMAKVDVDEIGEVAMKYNIQSVPTVYLMKKGLKVDSFVGLREEDDIRNLIEKNL